MAKVAFKQAYFPYYTVGTILSHVVFYDLDEAEIFFHQTIKTGEEIMLMHVVSSKKQILLHFKPSLR